MANCATLAERMLNLHRPTLNPAGFHKTYGGGSLSSVQWLGEFCRCPQRLRLQGIKPPPSIIRSSSPLNSSNCKKATATVDEEDFPVMPSESLLSSPLMIVPPFSEAEEDDDYNDYFHFFSVAEQKKLKVKKLGLRWQREYLTPDNAFCISSSHGWFVFLDPRNSNLYLFNPLITQSNDFPYIPLPSLETIELQNGFRVLKSDYLSPSPSLIRHGIGLPYNSSPCKSKEMEVDRRYVYKIVLSSSPLLDNCTVMMNYLGCLYFCKLGDEKWTELYDEDLSFYSVCDLVYFSKNGRFYGLSNDANDHVETWDLGGNGDPPKIALMEATFSNQKMKEYMLANLRIVVKYLVESSGDLLLVYRSFDKIFDDFGKGEEEEQLRDSFHYGSYQRTLRFFVYKLNFNVNKWEYVECLNDRALFVGYNHAFSLSTNDYPELRENSIYFTENSKDLALVSNEGRDNGVFHLEDNSITFYRTRDWKRINPLSIWVPSPVWVAPDAK